MGTKSKRHRRSIRGRTRGNKTQDIQKDCSIRKKAKNNYGTRTKQAASGLIPQRNAVSAFRGPAAAAPTLSL
jgi:hypothetical protein